MLASGVSTNVDRSREYSFHAGCVTEMNSEHAWTCGSSKGLGCRRFINRGAFSEVYEVSQSSISLTDPTFFRWFIKSLLGSDSKRRIHCGQRSFHARYSESTELLKRMSDLKRRILRSFVRMVDTRISLKSSCMDGCKGSQCYISWIWSWQNSAWKIISNLFSRMYRCQTF